MVINYICRRWHLIFAEKLIAIPSFCARNTHDENTIDGWMDGSPAVVCISLLSFFFVPVVGNMRRLCAPNAVVHHTNNNALFNCAHGTRVLYMAWPTMHFVHSFFFDVCCCRDNRISTVTRCNDAHSWSDSIYIIQLLLACTPSHGNWMKIRF